MLERQLLKLCHQIIIRGASEVYNEKDTSLIASHRLTAKFWWGGNGAVSYAYRKPWHGSYF
jgi:hypothetical protein